MPSRNIIHLWEPNSAYHIYNRGVAKTSIFGEPLDYKHFIGILKRHLDPYAAARDSSGKPYKKYDSQIDLLAFCLMTNHFHLLLYQKVEKDSLKKFMMSLSTAYAMYYNLKYQRVGPLFQSRFKARKIFNNDDLVQVAKYIHLNPGTPLTYPWSSIGNFLGTRHSAWVKPRRILSLTGDYLEHFEANPEV